MCMCMCMCTYMCVCMCMCMCMCECMCVCMCMGAVQRAILVVAAGLGLTCGVTGDTCGQFWPVGGLLEAGVVVLRVGVKCWAVPRVRGKRWDHWPKCRN